MITLQKCRYNSKKEPLITQKEQIYYNIRICGGVLHTIAANDDPRQIKGGSMKKILIVCCLFLVISCFLFAVYALQPSTKSSSGDRVPAQVDVQTQAVQESHVQQENTDPTTSSTKRKSLDEWCKTLSAQSEYEYHVVSGEVIRAGLALSPPVDCFDEACMEQFKRKMAESWTFARLRPLDGDETNDEDNFTIYTRHEPREALLKKPPYMVAGKRYAFCARGPELPSEYSSETVYRIDDVDTIQKME